MPATAVIAVVDSHTAGEPTRVVVDGGPALRGATLAGQRADLTARHDDFRAAVACEPRGSDVMVGALLVPPVAPGCVAGMIFFNNVGTLGMCGHGTIGVVATLAHLGRIGPGRHRLDTPVGPVEATLHADGRVTVFNVPSHRHAAAVAVEVPGVGRVVGDVAWGGNWFFLVDLAGVSGAPALVAGEVAALSRLAAAIRRALVDACVTGADGAEIDHVELYEAADGGARNFVLCPGLAWDRSPCGTGTSAKLACLAADGRLAPGAPWRQRSVVGGEFEATYATSPAPEPATPGAILPAITGRAWITAESRLLRAPDDPFRDGLPALAARP